MYGRILGFQRLARCPKWTPASIKSFTWTMATHCPPFPFREVKAKETKPNAQCFLPPRTRGRNGISYQQKGEGSKVFVQNRFHPVIRESPRALRVSRAGMGGGPLHPPPLSFPGGSSGQGGLNEPGPLQIHVGL